MSWIVYSSSFKEELLQPKSRITEKEKIKYFDKVTRIKSLTLYLPTLQPSQNHDGLYFKEFTTQSIMIEKGKYNRRLIRILWNRMNRDQDKKWSRAVTYQNITPYLAVFVAIGTSQCKVFSISALISVTLSCQEKKKKKERSILTNICREHRRRKRYKEFRDIAITKINASN